jgi:hypothetical protein
MTQTSERCPHCVIEPMYAAVSPWGGCYLQCLGCGYYDAVTRKPDPRPSVEVHSLYADGQKRARFRMPPGKFDGLTNAQSLTLLRKLARKLKRTPKVDEMGVDCPSASWYRTRFGTFATAVTMAGLELRRRGRDKRRAA